MRGLLILTILGIVFLSGCLNSYSNSDNNLAQNESSQIRKVCSEITNSTIRSLCYASFLGDASYCNSISNLSYKDDCYALTAFATKSVDYCSMVDSGFKKEGCTDLYFYSTALSRRNPLGCGNISDRYSRYKCYRGIVLLEHDLSICGNLDEPFKSDCEKFVIIGPYPGSGIIPHFSDLIDYVGLYSSMDCNRLTNSESRMFCTALATKNPFLCQYLKDDNSTAPGEYSNKLGNYANELYQICMLDIAFVNKDCSLCSQAYSEEYYPQCYSECDFEIAMMTNNFSPDYEGVPVFLSIYFKDSALEKGIEFCNYTHNETIKKMCLAYFKAAKGDVSECSDFYDFSFVGNYLSKDFCYTYAAEHQENPSICNIITNSTARDECYLSSISYKRNHFIYFS